ncbi:MAG: hypothetical protein J7497_13810 [Chitinophagaceae bacterium]|nr:hypothetical protein [Chitinophagaceae bacterium]
MRSSLIAITILLLFTACKKHSSSDRCQDFSHALMKEDFPAVKSVIDKWCNEAGSVPVDASFETVKQKFQQIVDKVNNECELQATLLCTMCIETLPPQTEIIITSGSKKWTLDLTSEEGHFISLVSVHIY